MIFANLKSLTIPEGIVTKIVSAGVTLWEAIKYKNWVPFSTTADGKTIYNGGLGYKDNTRLNSSAADVSKDGYAVCGYIPVKANDIVRLKGLTWSIEHNSNCYFWSFNSSYTKIKYLRPERNISDVTWIDEGNGVVAFTIQNNFTTCKYIRLSAYGSGANAIITVNEEIK